MTDDIPQEPDMGGGTTKLFSIPEYDLAELERILPQLADSALMFMTAPQMDEDSKRTHTRTRKQIEKVKEILSNIRWDYGPHVEIGIVSP